MIRLSLVRCLLLVVIVMLAIPAPATAAPEGQLTYAVHISLVSRWLDPGELEGLITPGELLRERRALHQRRLPRH
jgi:hypothetical protein